MKLVKCIGCNRIGTWSSSRCPECSHAYNRAHNSERDERYRKDSEHVAQRKLWSGALLSGPIPCARCGKPITIGMRWHLDHLPNGQSRPSHSRCNLRATYTDGNRPPAKRGRGK